MDALKAKGKKVLRNMSNPSLIVAAEAEADFKVKMRKNETYRI